MFGLKNTLINLVITFAILNSTAVSALNYSLQDAHAFKQLFNQSTSIHNQALALEYLSRNSIGQRILGKRIGGADVLANSINNHRQSYQHAIDTCLPAASNIEIKAKSVVAETMAFLKVNLPQQISFLFGSNNTGATVGPEHIVLGLEVICQQADTVEEAEKILLEYIAHEAIHVAQYQLSKHKTQRFTLLEMSIIEGTADYISDMFIDSPALLQQPREHYGKAHHAEIWSQFLTQANSYTFSPWLYSPSTGSMPSDMGYWLGKQIAKHYVENAQHREEAIRELLTLEDANLLLSHTLPLLP